MRGSVLSRWLYCQGTYASTAPAASPIAVIVRRRQPSRDHPAASTSSDTMAAANALYPEKGISQEKAKRKCHHPSRHPSGEIASSTRATAASPSPKYAPYVVQFRVTRNAPRYGQFLLTHPSRRRAAGSPKKRSTRASNLNGRIADPRDTLSYELFRAE